MPDHDQHDPVFAGVDAGTVSDALDALDIGSPHNLLRSLWEGARVAGPVVTTSLAAGAAPVGTAKIHLGVRAIAHAQPGEVIVMANEGRVDMGSWGGLLTRAAQKRGVAGVIVDGVSRDLDEAREAGFPAFGLGTTPRTARGRCHEVSCGEPVTVAGTVVRTGDWVIADGSGVVFVPADRVDEVAAKARELAAREAGMIDRIEAGDSPQEIFGIAYEDMLVQPAGEK